MINTQSNYVTLNHPLVRYKIKVGPVKTVNPNQLLVIMLLKENNWRYALLFIIGTVLYLKGQAALSSLLSYISET